MECSLHVSAVQGTRLDEAEVVFLCEGLSLVRGHRAQVPQVRLVAHLREEEGHKKVRFKF